MRSTTVGRGALIAITLVSLAAAQVVQAKNKVQAKARNISLFSKHKSLAEQNSNTAKNSSSDEVDTLKLPPKYEYVIPLDSAHLAWAQAAFISEVNHLRSQRGLVNPAKADPEFTKTAQETAEELTHASMGDIRHYKHYYGRLAFISSRTSHLGILSPPGTVPSECILSFADQFNPQDSTQLANHMRYAAWDLTQSPKHAKIIFSAPNSNTPAEVSQGSFPAGVGLLLRAWDYPNTPAMLQGNVQLIVVYSPCIYSPSAESPVSAVSAAP